MAEFTWSRRYTWLVGGVLLLVVAVVGFNLWRIEVVFESAPPGAVVRIDGRGIGLTPLTVELTPGRHRIELTHSHYVPHEETLEVARGDRLTRTIRMQSGIGALSLLSNPRGAWVELNDVRQEGVTPLRLDAVTTGPTTIRMGLTERRAVEKEVIVLADQLLEVNLELNIDPHGSLTVRTSPAGARVTLPELDVEYRAGVRIPIGEQLIRVERTGYETQQIRYNVRYGDNSTRVSLTRALGAMSVNVRPTGARISLTYEKDPGRDTTVDFKPGMQLPIGRVEVSARAIGYRTGFKAVQLGREGRTVNLTLEPMDVNVGETFRDPLTSGGTAPLMIVLPAGEFVMGDADGPPSMRPARKRTLSQPFAMSVGEVSIAEYRAFAEATGHKVDDRLVTPEEPARYLKWSDAVAYAGWLTAETGAKYRLPTEAEWEYAARAATTSLYSFGESAAELCKYGNLADQSTGEIYRQWDVADCDDGFAKLAPVGSFRANAFGLYDMHGNVSEWVQECGMPGYGGAVEDGAVVNTGQSCRTHGIRGGSWDSQPEALESARRGFGEDTSDDRGIRLVREL